MAQDTKPKSSRCSDRCSTPRKVGLLISKLSIKNDINLNPLLSAAGMAEWVSHLTLGQRFQGSKVRSFLQGLGGEDVASEEKKLKLDYY